jgi:MEMO1 family protein
MEREPAVAGQFYPADKEKLRTMLAAFMPRHENRKVFGVVSPHAGYIYSGGVAGRTFAQVQVPDQVIILGPNHHGVGHHAALYPGGFWQTPLGPVAIAAQLSNLLLENCPALAEDDRAHRFEHSLEVQVPFLQYLNPSVRLVPICLGRLDLQALLELGRQLGNCLKQQENLDVLLVASSDMTHYESAEQAQRKDHAAIEKICALDAEGLYRVVAERRISMCGVLPTVVLLQACKQLGARKASLVEYTNSAAVTGDQREVVGYAGMVIE